MAKTQDIARSMAAAPLSTLESRKATAETFTESGHAEKTEPMEVNPLILADGFGEPEFFPSSSQPFTDPETKVVTATICNVNIPLLALPGAVFRCRVQRRFTPAVQDGLTGHTVETTLQLPNIARGSIQAIEAGTPEADSRIKAWRYMVVKAAEDWLEKRGGSSTTVTASSNAPRLIKFVAAPSGSSGGFSQRAPGTSGNS